MAEVTSECSDSHASASDSKFLLGEAYALTGFHDDEIEKILQLSPEPAAEHEKHDLLASLLFMKWSLSWNCVRCLMGTYESQKKSTRTWRRRVCAFLHRWSTDILRPNRRFSESDEILGQRVTFLVDTFPVYTYGKNTKRFSGHKKRAYRKFQVLVSAKEGAAFAVSKGYDGSADDNAIFAREAQPAVHVVGEFGLADGAYANNPHLLIPHRKPLQDEAEKTYNLHLRLIRSRVEHFFGRMHRFRFVQNCFLRDNALIDDMVRFAVEIVTLLQFPNCARVSATPRGAVLCGCGWTPATPSTVRLVRKRNRETRAKRPREDDNDA